MAIEETPGDEGAFVPAFRSPLPKLALSAALKLAGRWQFG
jgi:hypothetical protein|tara:strand:+ start:203 stop:322 length:120 start_codon:yes stop_codon:yes gene_type:complete